MDQGLILFRIKAQLCLLGILSLSVLQYGCVKGVPSTNPTVKLDYKLISSGVETSLTSLQQSFQILANTATDPAQKAKWQSASDSLSKILAVVSPIAATLQTTTFPAANAQQLIDEITNLANVAASVGGTVGLPSDVVIAINLGVGVFKSLEPLIVGPSSTTSPVAAMSPVAPGTNATAAATDPRTQLGQLQAVDSKIKSQVIKP